MSANNFGAKKSNLKKKNISTWRAAKQAYKFGYNFFRACTSKIWEDL